MSGRVEAIWVKPAHRGPLVAADDVRAIAHSGLEGNSHQGGRRQVTLLSARAWNEVQKELDRQLDPSLRRANLLLAGVDLGESKDRVILVGSVPILIHGETRPCERMEQACPGLRATLARDWRGGAYGKVLRDGTIRVGDVVEWTDDPRLGGSRA